MLTVKVNADGLIRSLTNLQQEFVRTSTNAVVQAASELTSNIVFKTLSPPPIGPPAKYYVRTHRLVHGWGPAARLFEIYMPPLSPFALTESDEGSAHLVENENGSYFRAENRVPYAVEVEYEGTWGPGRKMRGGYDIVGSSEREMKGEGKFPQYVSEAWTLAKNAA